jgi:ABC-type transporter Mla MlaB component
MNMAPAASRERKLTRRPAQNKSASGESMENPAQSEEDAYQLKFGGKMTYESFCEQKSRLVDAMRRYKKLEIDLSEVSEIDLCGIHLVGLLRNVGAIVATSPVVEQAAKGLPPSLNAAALGRSERAEHVAAPDSPAK